MTRQANFGLFDASNLFAFIMSIHVRYKITCTQCGLPAPDRGAETEEEAIGFAADDGWNQHRVQNGSLWELCPECWRRFRSEANTDISDRAGKGGRA